MNQHASLKQKHKNIATGEKIYCLQKIIRPNYVFYICNKLHISSTCVRVVVVWVFFSTKKYQCSKYLNDSTRFKIVLNNFY
jgi:hypothetical protein